MANTMTDHSLFTKMIDAGIKHRISEIMGEEIKKAQENIETRVRGEIDKIALNLCREYSVERMGADLRIVVRKQI